MGLCASIPVIMKEKGATYESLSLFSLVSLPFSMKLIWAPIVDSCYFKEFGRRKSWLIPVQFVTGIVMIFGSGFLGNWLGESGEVMNVFNLTIFFFMLYFLMATQDIAVDGWGLTMLSRENVGLASICNSIGQVIGVFLANQGFIALSDSTWCHRFLGMELGKTFVTLPQFMRFWGIVFIVVTIFVWIFKKEEAQNENEEPTANLLQTCIQIGSIFRLSSVQLLIVILLTFRASFAPADAVFGFKLQENGMPKSDIATYSPILMLISLLLPAILGKYVSANPLDSLLIAIPTKLITSILMVMMTFYTKYAYANGNKPGLSYFGPLILIMTINEIGGTLSFISIMSFFNKVSDPAIGGSYMTLLNTMANLGSKWPSFLSLYLLPSLTISSCIQESQGVKRILDYSCILNKGDECINNGGQCIIQFDGYLLETGICFLFGIVWLLVFKNVLTKLQALPHEEWLVNSRNKLT